MRKRQWIISLVTTLLVLIIGASIFQIFKAQKKSTVSDGPPKLDISYVEAEQFPRSTVTGKIPIDGRLNAFEKIEVAAEVTGRLLRGAKSWRKGSYFKKGALLFSIDREDEQLSLFASRSNLLNAITQIMPDLKFDYPEAYQKWKNYLDQFNIEEATAELPKVSSPQEKYYIAGKNIYNLYYSIKSAEDRLGNFRVYAPFSGVFLNVNAYPGTLVSPGASLGQIMNTSQFELETPIPTKEIKLVKIGQKVKLYADELGTEYSGTISRVGKQIDQTTQSIPVFIAVQGRGLRDGMYLKGQLEGSELSEVSVLPQEAIVNQNQIYYIQDSTIMEKEVDIVLRSDQEIFVRGLSPELQVITKGLNSLSPGQRAVAL